MPRRITYSVFLLLFIIPALLQAQTRRVKLTVKGTDKKPIKDVKITLSSPEKDNFNKVVKTNKKGETSFLLQWEIRNLNFLLESEGYQSVKETASLRQLRKSQASLFYEHSFLLYRSDEFTPEQKKQKYKTNQQSLAFFNKGMELFQAEDFSGAIEQFKKAAETKKDFLEAYHYTKGLL